MKKRNKAAKRLYFLSLIPKYAKEESNYTEHYELAIVRINNAYFTDDIVWTKRAIKQHIKDVKRAEKEYQSNCLMWANQMAERW